MPILPRTVLSEPVEQTFERQSQWKILSIETSVQKIAERGRSALDGTATKLAIRPRRQYI